MNWRSVKFLTDDDYGKPILCRVYYKGYDEPRYTACYITKNHQYVAISNINGIQVMFKGSESIPDDICFIRIDEIKD